ncbi:alpha-tocopherol transfer protein-like [Drosophila kikkawai]|uniref:Alpha-tocopherol transfer protein-like n=1 Tax=Drosophila kikkawai TaxID=30033 RepID=A0A6P4IUT6_DROKI|nr:alpha-tocopherol transfer protein-like [Drosophila kikkawai]XP_017027175.1 alpha-tocopherol transfer protein-like [Drosophila kikkawai]
MANIRPLVPELAEVARTQLNEVDSEVVVKIEALRTWINEVDYLTARTDDQFLVAFLRFCRWDLEEAKKRLLFYYTYKTKERELLKSRLVDDKLLELTRSGIFATLPNPIGPGGPRIHFTRMGHIETSKYSVSDIFRFHAFRAEIEINTDDNWNIAGVVEILDFTKIPYSLLLQFDAGMFRRMNAFLEHGLPTNLVATHIVNASRETQFVLGLVRNVMKQKELLHIHPNLDSLKKAIGQEYLPAEMGGNNGTLPDAMSRYENQLNSFGDYFKEDEQYGVDEKLREASEAAAPVATSASTQGTFRKLNID